MKNLIRLLLRKTFKKQQITKVISKLADVFWIDLTPLHYNQHGILKWQNSQLSGESHILNKVLPVIFKNKKLIIFDVGANIGSYALELIDCINISKLYCFEPNPKAFEKLVSSVANIENISPQNIGFGANKEHLNIHVYEHDEETEHASIYKDVLNDLHRINKTKPFKIELSTLDEFCKEKDIETINFLKIDTEGHELSVLTGAQKLLQKGTIDVIQFEFNEMNVISRVFLKDFYDCLTDYDIYRMDSNRLIHLPRYESKNEIFQFQNFLAIHKKLEFKNV
jgi:FkbM family methyltransferase